MSKKQEVAVQENTGAAANAVSNIAAQAMELAKRGDQFGLSASDMRIATLLLMQPPSAFVNENKAKLGDIVHNDNEQVVGGLDKAIEVVPLYKFETVRVYDMTDKSPKFAYEVPYKKGDRVEKEGQEEIQTPEGKRRAPVKRYHTINFFLLLVDEIEKGESMPVLVRFKSTSFTAGNKMASYLWKKMYFGKLPYEQTAMISVEKRQNEKKQTWASFCFAEGKPTSEAGKVVAQQMLAQINSQKYTINDRFEEADIESETQAAPTVVPSVVQPQTSAKGPY